MWGWIHPVEEGLLWDVAAELRCQQLFHILLLGVHVLLSCPLAELPGPQQRECPKGGVLERGSAGSWMCLCPWALSELGPCELR